MKAAILLFSVACAGCGSDVFGPELQYMNRRPLDPVPDWYATEYALVEQCVGHPGSFDSVRWFVADILSLGSERLAGAVDFPDDIIFAVAHHTNQSVVRHEVEHHIRQLGDEIHLASGETPCARYVAP